jgi:tRNA-uridine 2-sulfurtransferase
MASKGSVLVAMSGGVDSSVAACLLAEQGHDVVGSHMRLVHLDDVEHGCCGPTARADAEAVARIGGFPFEIAEMTREFDERVIGDFTREQGAGRTPNPCARCNGEIKFGAFLRRAADLGVDAVATGHYVRTWRDGGGRWHLMRGADEAKDQSYMLHMLGQSQLARSLFPVGGMPKAEVRAHAARLGLPVATKPDSQELCFAPSGDAGGFVRSAVPELVRAGGAVVDADGRVVGEHDGTFAFTVGQRRGLGVALGRKAYVVDVDAGANRVTVGAAELLSRRGLVADRVTWVAGHAPAERPFEARVRVRYRGDDAPAVISPSLSGFTATFREPQRAIAPGQSAVVYRGDEMLGGGRIVSSFK